MVFYNCKKPIIGIVTCMALLTGCGTTTAVTPTPDVSTQVQATDETQSGNVYTPQEIRNVLVTYAKGKINTIHSNISSILSDYEDNGFETVCYGLTELSPFSPSMPVQYIDDISSFQSISEDEYSSYMQPLWLIVTYKDADGDVRTSAYDGLCDTPVEIFDIKGSCYDCTDSTSMKSFASYKGDNSSSFLINYSDKDENTSCVAMLTIDQSYNISVEWCAVMPRVIFNNGKATASKISKEWTVYTDCDFVDGKVDYSKGTVFAKNITISNTSDNTEWEDRKNWLRIDYEVANNGEVPSDEELEEKLSTDVCKRYLYFTSGWKNENALWKDCFNSDVIDKIDEISLSSGNS
jgi:hypothetical protein